MTIDIGWIPFIVTIFFIVLCCICSKTKIIHPLEKLTVVIGALSFIIYVMWGAALLCNYLKVNYGIP